MNNTPRGERLHIGIFGRRNAGKSSLLNAITGQNAAVVSDVKGTTTDPVYKSMELLPIGPIVLVDTAGIDDEGELAGRRIEKTESILRKTDLALLAIDPAEPESAHDEEMINTFEEMNVKYLIIHTKSDLNPAVSRMARSPHINISSTTGENIRELKELIAKTAAGRGNDRKLVSDLLAPGDMVVLVVPIDSAAPKGRLILPQQQVVRDIIEAGAFCMVARPEDLRGALAKLAVPPKLVITDSQAFAEVAKIVPPEIGLTSFSILMARYKGLLDAAVRAAAVIDTIKSGDKILIAEGCTHHRQCDDIGTVKIPRWLEGRTGATPAYTFVSGGDFPAAPADFKLIIHCGGCMQNPREMQSRQKAADAAGVPMTNYGIAISYMQGILERCIAPLPQDDLI